MSPSPSAKAHECYMTALDKIVSILDKEINKKLDGKIIQSIYGGITDQTLTKRKKEHIRDDEFNKHMKIKCLMTVSISNIYNFEFVKTLETLLINLLYENYENNSEINLLNDHNADGTIAQRGGAGERFRVGAKYKVYIMYEE